MLKLQFITAVRLLNKYRQHSILNIIGLAFGLAAAILVFLYASYETSYDKFHPAPEHTYRVAQNWPSLGLNAPVSSSAMNPHFSAVEGVTDILNLIHMSPVINNEIKINDSPLKLENLYATTANFAEFFTLEVVAGDLDKTLTTPNYIALSQSQALRLFGETSVLGKTLDNEQVTWTVGAIFKDLPENTHLKIDFLTSIQVQLLGEPNPLGNDSFTYVKVEQQQYVANIAAQYTQLYNDVVYRGENMVEVSLQRLSDIYLSANSRFEMKVHGSQFIVDVCIGLTFLLIAIASINFINMSTAQAVLRAKEVGVKKAMGASKQSLITQFLCESLVISTIATILAAIVAITLLPWFNAVIEKELSFDITPVSILFLLGIDLVVGLIAGLYPAFFLTAFDAKRVLSGDLTRGTTAVRIRKALMILQASLSIALIIGAFILHQQLNYMTTIETGYQKENRLEISGINRAVLFDNPDSNLARAFSQLPFVDSATISDTSLTKSINTSARLLWPGADQDVPIIPFIGTGFDPVKTQGLTLLHGRDFSATYTSDWHAVDTQGNETASIIISESVARMAGGSDLASLVGETWTFTTGEESDLMIRVKVVGIVSDLTIGSAKHGASPSFFICGYSWMNEGNVVLNFNTPITPIHKSEVTEFAQTRFNLFNLPMNEVHYNYENLYKSDRKTAHIVAVFSVLVVILTCVGIFGLCSFSANRRQKEIAVRKVLGASKLSLMNLLAKEFVVLTVISAAIAFPLTYMVTSDWLAGFNIRIEQPWFIYITALMLVSTIVWLTVASIAYKTASTRPANSLRYE